MFDDFELDGWLRFLLPILVFLLPWLWARLKAGLEPKDESVDPHRPIEPR